MLVAAGNEPSTQTVHSTQMMQTTPLIPTPPPEPRRRPQRLFPVGTLKKERDVVSLPRHAGASLPSRFSGIKPSNFGAAGVAIYTMDDTAAPEGFEDVWRPCGNQVCDGDFFESQKRVLSKVASVIMCVDVFDDEQVKRAVHLKRSMVSFVDVMPFVIVLPHPPIVGDRAGGPTDVEINKTIKAFKFNSIVFGEPKGLRLAIEVCGAIRSQRARLARKEETEHELDLPRKRELCRQEAERLHFYQEAMHDVVWDYARLRMKTVIPAIDFSIGRCETGDVISGLRIGHYLGKGGYGMVHRLEDPAKCNPVNQVLKILPKWKRTSFSGIKAVDAQIQVMQLLSRDDCSHPNISKLFGVHHTRDHLLFRISYGGPLDLQKRLTARDSVTTERHRPLAPRQVTQVISQCLHALCHLHLRAKVVHLDIKTDNIIVSETEEDIWITLTDFDFACAVETNSLCFSELGTFPYMAPEILLHGGGYDSFAADVWSMGDVCLQALCGVDILWKTSKSKKPCIDADHMRRQFMRSVVAKFGPRGSMLAFLEQRVQPELRQLQLGAASLIDGMLKVSPRDRWRSAEVAAELSSNELFRKSP